MYLHCPNCTSAATVEILYGYPGADLEERARHGLVALGGCVIGESEPTHRCLECSHQWLRPFLNPNHLTQDILCMLDDLETANTTAANQIENLFLSSGRGNAEHIPVELVDVFAEIHHAWANFSSLLHDFGETVQVYDDSGRVINEFATADAFDVMQKQLGQLYGLLGALANASLQLGQASKAGGVDEIKTASALVQEARARLNERRKQARALVIDAANL
jgi:hypothetical protein